MYHNESKNSVTVYSGASKVCEFFVNDWTDPNPEVGTFVQGLTGETRDMKKKRSYDKFSLWFEHYYSNITMKVFSKNHKNNKSTPLLPLHLPNSLKPTAKPKGISKVTSYKNKLTKANHHIGNIALSTQIPSKK